MVLVSSHTGVPVLNHEELLLVTAVLLAVVMLVAEVGLVGS